MHIQLRKWLQKEPHPSRVKAKLADGDEKTIRIGDSRSRWRDAAAALGQAVYAEALNDDGEVLRAWEDESEREPESAERAQMTANSNLAELANIMVEAADRSAARHADAYKLAYEQQRLLVEVLSKRLQMLEGAWHRLLMSQQQQMVDENGEPQGPSTSDMNSQMVMTLLAQAFGGMLMPPTAPAPAKGTTNGAGNQ